MSDLHVELTAPNGRKYAQPIGLFINNEFVKSKSGEKVTSINPTYVLGLLSGMPRPYLMPGPCHL
jgi:aldehyde dehydrogenase (NAD(P)+)